jgi:protoporphyrinogen oxidase
VSDGECGALPHTVVIGAGPAGLTAAEQLTGHGLPVTVVEADDVVGGISRTVEREGWRFDIGGHRFFTKVPAVEQWWHQMLDDSEFLSRPRLSRIYYAGKMFDYPLRPWNALRGLGLLEAVRCLLSYAAARVRPPRDQSNFEGWVAARFGWRLYSIFFKTYTEKVWGVPASAIQADWAAQRIKNLSLGRAVLSALRPRAGQTDVPTLIDRFQYPALGPGMMWERTRERVLDGDGTVLMRTRCRAVHRSGGRAVAVSVETASDDGTAARTHRIAADHVISSMPLPDLVRAMDPPAPPEVRLAAAALSHRDFLTVALVVPEDAGFADNWIYIHSSDVRVGRIQNFGSWSPYLVKDGRTCLGLEYFVNEGDEIWSADDADLVALATAELARLNLAEPHQVERGYVVRAPKAYPVYDRGYEQQVDVIRDWLATAVPNVHPVGRNGMHKYNNQDHSMLTAMLTVENIATGTQHDVWAVNVDDDYHEGGPATGVAAQNRTGRSAPVLPRRPARSA